MLARNDGTRKPSSRRHTEGQKSDQKLIVLLDFHIDELGLIVRWCSLDALLSLGRTCTSLSRLCKTQALQLFSELCAVATTRTSLMIGAYHIYRFAERFGKRPAVPVQFWLAVHAATQSEDMIMEWDMAAVEILYLVYGSITARSAGELGTFERCIRDAITLGKSQSRFCISAEAVRVALGLLLAAPTPYQQHFRAMQACALRQSPEDAARAISREEGQSNYQPPSKSPGDVDVLGVMYIDSWSDVRWNWYSDLTHMLMDLLDECFEEIDDVEINDTEECDNPFCCHDICDCRRADAIFKAAHASVPEHVWAVQENGWDRHWLQDMPPLRNTMQWIQNGTLLGYPEGPERHITDAANSLKWDTPRQPTTCPRILCRQRCEKRRAARHQSAHQDPVALLARVRRGELDPPAALCGPDGVTPDGIPSRALGKRWHARASHLEPGICEPIDDE